MGQRQNRNTKEVRKREIVPLISKARKEKKREKKVRNRAIEKQSKKRK
jgi:hypothetical protein